MSRVMLLMRLVSLSPYFLSFVPSPGSSLHCKTSRSGHSGGRGGGGKERHIGKEWWWCGNLWEIKGSH